jgi:hypothetical protein
MGVPDVITPRRTLLLLAALALPCAARAELADPVARAVADNPALAAIAAGGNAAQARALAAEAAAILAAPPGESRAGGPPGSDAALLRANPLLEATHRHDPAAALDLLARVKQAGGTRR